MYVRMYAYMHEQEELGESQEEPRVVAMLTNVNCSRIYVCMYGCVYICVYACQEERGGADT